MHRHASLAIRSVLLAALGGAGSLAATGPFYFSVDLGSDLELSDPGSPGVLDPGDIYCAPPTNAQPGAESEPAKDDAWIDPASSPPDPLPASGLGAPVGGSLTPDPRLYDLYFDLDGEDQLERLFFAEEGLEGWMPIVVDSATIRCLHRNPHSMYLSFDDDGAPGWVSSPADVSTTAGPEHGTTAMRDEVVVVRNWGKWDRLSPVADEVMLGLGPNPDGDARLDDDVDALDRERCDYWYWSCDREARYDAIGSGAPLDAGAIYVTLPSSGGSFLAFPPAALGLPPGTDIDAFEFCSTDDPDVLQNFPRLRPGLEYLAVAFSVDEDDPVTVGEDESGGLNPRAIYLSLLDGDAPLKLTEFEEDVDAIAFDNTRELCVKWEQPLDCVAGVDVILTPDGGEGPRLFDDWLCDGRPVVGVRWWGSYRIWENAVPEPVPPPLPDRPASFRLTWYEARSGVPANPIAVEFFPLAPYGHIGAPGLVSERHACAVDLAPYGLQAPAMEHEYAYEAVFTNAWNEKAGSVYWLGIEPVYTNEKPAHAWGWKTTSPLYGYGAPAYWTEGLTATNLHWPPPGWTDLTNHPYAGQPVDMAFELLTDVCPARCHKWSLLPDLVEGEDLLSWTTNASPAVVAPQYPLVAAPFVSDGRPITDVHWWGSYPGWSGSVGGTEPHPVPPPAGLDRPLGFRLSWHADTNCSPLPPMVDLFVPMRKAHEVFYATQPTPWAEEPFEQKYQYYVDLLDPEVSGQPWRETNNVAYWLNVQAVFAPAFPVGKSHRGWGWATAQPPKSHCPGHVTTNGVSWQPVHYASPHPLAPQAAWPAFELTTDAYPTNGLSGRVRFTAIDAVTATAVSMVSTGDCPCGVQVLQTATNLSRANPWSDVETRGVPRPRHAWRVDGVSSQQFFRIRMRPAP
jgi:hypothetical protein